MPKYINYKTDEFGHITVKPRGIRKILKFIPYVTMEKIELEVNVERLPMHHRNAFIRYGDGSYKTLITIDEKTYISETAHYSGDTKIWIASYLYSAQKQKNLIEDEGYLIFYDHVLPKRDYILGSGCFIAIIILIVEVLSNFVFSDLFLKLINQIH